MEKVNLAHKFSLFQDHWRLRTTPNGLPSFSLDPRRRGWKNGAGEAAGLWQAAAEGRGA